MLHKITPIHTTHDYPKKFITDNFAQILILISKLRLLFGAFVTMLC